MGGWAAATGELSAGAWILFAILFAWQHPHFFAIAWLHRDDYARGGFKMLPVIEPDGRSTVRQMLIYSVLLIVVSILPTFYGIAGYTYLIGAVLLGVVMLTSSIVFGQTYRQADARRVLLSSLIYLPALFLLIIGDSVV